MKNNNVIQVFRVFIIFLMYTPFEGSYYIAQNSFSKGATKKFKKEDPILSYCAIQFGSANMGLFVLAS